MFFHLSAANRLASISSAEAATAEPHSSRLRTAAVFFVSRGLLA